MAKVKNEKKTVKKEANDNTLWRKPITLDSFEDEDPLATLYQGREVVDRKETAEISPEKRKATKTKSAKKNVKNSQKIDSLTKPEKSTIPKTNKPTEPVSKSKINKQTKATASTKITEEELRNLLRIKSDSFEFTDIREILRGKSLDIYAYLRFLAGDAGVCKITHNDLMKAVNISRPTLFKQSDWLEKLSLIEKYSVPGDHTGTSYTVHPLEDTLPISNTLIKQLKSYIETIMKKN